MKKNDLAELVDRRLDRPGVRFAGFRDGVQEVSAVLLALFKDHETAESVRAELVRDGFPTDRVEDT